LPPPSTNKAQESDHKSVESRGKRGRFLKGHKNGGRPKGLKNKYSISAEITPVKELAAQLLLDQTYLNSLIVRLRSGDAPHMEKFFAEHLWGKPKEQIEHSGTITLAHVLIERISTAKERALGKKELSRQSFYPQATQRSA
jgi:hypothetical protein